MFEMVNQSRALGLLVAGASGVFWTLTYLLVIARGARDRTCGMPLTALCANLAWELVFTGVTVSNGALDVRLALLVPCTALDYVILVQAFRYGRRDVDHPLVRRYFKYGLGGLLLFATAVLFTFVWQVEDAIGWYAAFGQNLMMSALFVSLLLRRRDLRGQSVYIGLAKLLGTLFAFLFALFWSPPTLQEHWASMLPDAYHPVSPLIVVLYSGTFVLDVIYVALLLRTSRDLGLDPWRWLSLRPPADPSGALAPRPARAGRRPAPPGPRGAPRTARGRRARPAPRE